MEKRLYDSARWRKARLRFLAEHPLCADCEQQGIETPATVVDHKEQHKGDYDLFWDESKWQPLCASHHSRRKQIKERRGCDYACGVDGTPIDPGHPWNKTTG